MFWSARWSRRMTSKNRPHALVTTLTMVQADRKKLPSPPSDSNWPKFKKRADQGTREPHAQDEVHNESKSTGGSMP